MSCLTFNVTQCNIIVKGENMIPIIPKPKSIKLRKGHFVFNKSTVILSDKSLLEPYLKLDESNFDNMVRTIIDTSLNEEAYGLEITTSEVILKASSETGLFYGNQSLIQLIQHYGASIPCMVIEDLPLYRHRGFMLDVGRHFFDKTYVKKLLDICALHKLNVFHFHLTEDQGWRLAIDKYPRLTSIGSKRKETLIRGKSDHKPVEGFYSKEDIKEIVSYAKNRHIKVIPEIDIPGHLQAALAAYPELGCFDEALEVRTAFGISHHVACAGKDFTYEFFENVLDEVCDLFDSDVIHLGGDEVPKKNWKKCVHCQNKMKANKLETEEDLQSYFINHMAGYLETKKRKVICWNEALRSKVIDPNIVIQHWMSKSSIPSTVNAANSGRQVIVSDYFNHYLDYPYSMTPLEKTYNSEVIISKVANKDNILGLETCLWTEFVDNESHLEFMVFPRLTALAERAWSCEKNYEDFKKRLVIFNKLLDRYDINYAKHDQVDIKGIKGKVQTLAFFLRSITLGDILSIFNGV